MSDGRLTVKLSLLLTEISRYTVPAASIAAIAAVVVSFLLLVLLLVVLLYKFRDKILQQETFGCIYAAVKTADPGVEVVNV